MKRYVFRVCSCLLRWQTYSPFCQCREVVVEQSYYHTAEHALCCFPQSGLSLVAPTIPAKAMRASVPSNWRVTFYGGVYQTSQLPRYTVFPILHHPFNMGVEELKTAQCCRLRHLGVDVNKPSGDNTFYIHQRGPGTIHQPAMVEQYLKTHGKITRAEVAELCKISLPQAYRLLQALVKHGIAAIQGGKGRGVFYIYRSE